MAILDKPTIDCQGSHPQQDSNTISSNQDFLYPEDRRKINECYQEIIQQREKRALLFDSASEDIPVAPEETVDIEDLVLTGNVASEEHGFSRKAILSIGGIAAASAGLIFTIIQICTEPTGPQLSTLTGTGYDERIPSHLQLVTRSLANSDNVRIIFLGDDFVQGWLEAGAEAYSDYVSMGATNFGVKGDTIENLDRRVQEIALNNNHPSFCVVHIGSKDLLRNTKTDIVQRVVSLVEQIKLALSRTEVIFIGVLPHGSREIAEEAVALNQELVSFFAGSIVRVLDMSHLYYHGNGEFVKELFTSDLQKLSTAGYYQWKYAMDPFLTLSG